MLVNQRTSLRRTHTSDQRKLRMATRRFQAALQEEMRRRVSKSRVDIEALVEADHTREVWININIWTVSKYPVVSG